MRVLHIHKFFFPHAGSETVYFHTRELLTSHGHEVVDFAMSHPDNVESPYSDYFAPHRDYNDRSISAPRRLRDAAASVYSPAVRTRLKRLIKDTRPDVAHMHIIYHQLTLAVVDELHAQGVPSVMTMHDYKIGCPAYVLYRDGEPCELCTHGPVENSLRHRCIKGSTAASALAAVEARAARARGTYGRIDAFIGPSRFVGENARQTGIPAHRIHHIPNFLPAEELEPAPAGNAMASEPRFLFAGRVEEVKGVLDLLAAYDRAARDGGPDLGTLVIAGTGELDDVVRKAADENPSVVYLGRLTRADLRLEMERARAVLVPSRWHENNPMSLLEARAVAVPVIATAMGGLPEMVTAHEDGHVVPRGDVGAIIEAIASLVADPASAARMGEKGRERLLRDNTPEEHYRRLTGVYDAAIEERAARGRS